MDDRSLGIYCGICGQVKIHFRMRGYRCQNPDHETDENNIVVRFLEHEKPKIRCGKCQAENFPGLIYCRFCGEHLKGEK